MTPIGWYAFRMAQISPEDQVEVIKRCIAPLSEAIKDCEGQITNALSANDDDNFLSVRDEENEIIDNLLGIVFVVCQNYITYVISTVTKIHSYCDLKGKKLKTSSTNKVEILNFGIKNNQHSNFSNIQLIDACGNYFKHQDEWPNKKWEFLIKPKQRRIIDVFRTLNIGQLSTYKFCDAAVHLGITSFSDLEVFSTILLEWGNAIYFAYSSELSSLGLIQNDLFDNI